MNKPLRTFEADSAVPARFTRAEFLRMVEGGAFDDMKVELVDGVLDRMNPPLSGHAWLQSSVVAALWPIAKEAEFFVLGEAGVDLGADTVRAADVVMVRALPETRRLLLPDEILLLVEISETTRARDTGPKRIDYAAAGIAWYWVVDSERSVIHVYGDPIKGDYAEIRTVKFGAPLSVPGTDATITID